MKINWIILIIGIILIILGILKLLAEATGWLVSSLSGIAFIIIYKQLSKSKEEKKK